ncbi:hypothetical protein HDU76_003492, partial [Blyttiomyces sp. JEL0837]
MSQVENVVGSIDTDALTVKEKQFPQLPVEVWSQIARELHLMGTPSAQHGLYGMTKTSRDLHSAALEWLWCAPILDGFKQTNKLLRGLQISIAIAKSRAAARILANEPPRTVDSMLTSSSSLSSRNLHRLVSDGDMSPFHPVTPPHEPTHDQTTSIFEKANLIYGNGSYIRSLVRTARTPDSFVNEISLTTPNLVEAPEGFWKLERGDDFDVVVRRRMTIGGISMSPENQDRLRSLSKMLDKEAEAEAAARKSANAIAMAARASYEAERRSASPQPSDAEKDGWLGSGKVTTLANETTTAAAERRRGGGGIAGSGSSMQSPKREVEDLFNPDLSEQDILGTLLPTDKKLATLLTHFPQLTKLVLHDQCVTASPDAVLRIAIMCRGEHLTHVALTAGQEGSRMTISSVLSVWIGCPRLREFRIEGIDFSRGRAPHAPVDLWGLSALPSKPCLTELVFKECLIPWDDELSTSAVVERDGKNSMMSTATSMNESMFVLTAMVTRAPNLEILNLTDTALSKPPSSTSNNTARPTSTATSWRQLWSDAISALSSKLPTHLRAFRIAFTHVSGVPIPLDVFENIQSRCPNLVALQLQGLMRLPNSMAPFLTSKSPLLNSSMTTTTIIHKHLTTLDLRNTSAINDGHVAAITTGAPRLLRLLIKPEPYGKFTDDGLTMVAEGLK